MKRRIVTGGGLVVVLLATAPWGALAETEEPPPGDPDKLAELEATQRELENKVEEMRKQLVEAADSESEENRAAIEALSKQVQELKAEIDAQTEEGRAAREEMQKEIDVLAPSKGFTIKGPGESYLKLGALLQARMEGAKDAAPSGDNWSFDTYLRRMRLMAFGQLNKWVNFFIETDNPNFGKGGGWDGGTFIQDAYLEINVHEAFQVDLGMLLLPFSHQGMQGATSLFGMDYHSALVKYPAGSHKVWRDAGVMFRGLFAGGHVEYRLGLFNGVSASGLDPRNPDDLPRLTGRLTFNVFEAEGGSGPGGMFYDGLYIKKTDQGVVSTKRVLSFGSSVDWQPDLNVGIEDPEFRVLEDDPYEVETREDYIATAWDVFWDIPFGRDNIMSVNGQVNLYYYYYGDRSLEPNDAGAPTRFYYYDELEDTTTYYTGFGLSSEVGFRYSAMQPLVLVDFYEATKSDFNRGDYISIAGGFNYYLFGHNTTLKLQVGADNVAKDADNWGLATKFQAQLLF